jgi:hypothetical protein
VADAEEKPDHVMQKVACSKGPPCANSAGVTVYFTPTLLLVKDWTKKFGLLAFYLNRFKAFLKVGALSTSCHYTHTHVIPKLNTTHEFFIHTDTQKA